MAEDTIGVSELSVIETSGNQGGLALPEDSLSFIREMGTANEENQTVLATLAAGDGHGQADAKDELSGRVAVSSAAVGSTDTLKDTSTALDAPLDEVVFLPSSSAHRTHGAPPDHLDSEASLPPLASVGEVQQDSQSTLQEAEADRAGSPEQALYREHHHQDAQNSTLPKAIGAENDAAEAAQPPSAAAAPASDAHPEASSSSSKSSKAELSHKRLESVVPQRYDLPELSPLSMQAAGSSSAFRRTSLAEGQSGPAGALAEEGGQYAGVRSPTFSSASYTYADGRPLRPAPRGRQGQGSEEAPSRPRSRTLSEEVEAIGFVDVALESPAPGSANGSTLHDQRMMRSPYGAGIAFGSRSSVEIRQDSIASGSSAAQRVAAAAAHRDRMLRRTISQEGAASQSNSESGTLSLRSSFASGRDAPSTNGAEDARTSAESARSSTTDRRMAGEGRYMGRRSRPTSRAVTPTEMDAAAQRFSSGSRGASPAPVREPSLPVEGAGDPIHGSVLPGISMMCENEDGEIEEYVAEDTHPVPSRASEQGGGRLSSASVGAPIAVSLEEEQDHRHEASIDAPREAEQCAAKQKGSPVAEAAQPPAAERQEGSSTSSSEDPISTSATSVSASEAVGLSTDIDRAPGLKDIADSESEGKSRRRSNGPSALEQYMSRTRMTTLPPKERNEDAKHLSDFEQMMRSYKQTEKKKAEEMEERKRQKDIELASAQAVWAQEILPSWTRARRENRLRAVWWKGAPPNLRGRIWALACGNAQMLPRNLFHSASAEAKKATREERFPMADAEAIETDIANTLPSLKLFQRDVGPLYDDLRDVLQAYVMVRMDQLRATAVVSLSVTAPLPLAYQAGAASLTAMLLSNLSPSETLVALLNLLAERPWLRALYTPIPSGPAPSASHLHSQTPITPSFRQDAAAGFERVFDTLLADQMPKVYANMQARGVRPSAYVRDWARTLFVPFLPFDAVARLWDCILLEEGDALIFRTGLALVKLLSARLYVPDKTELTSILRGNNAAALRVYYRDAALTNPGAPSPIASASVASAHPSLPVVSSPVGAQTLDLPATPSTAGSTVMQSPSSTLAPSSAGSTIIADASWVPRDNIYAQYGINEEMLFQALEEQNEWWRDSTLERLLDRELS